MLRGEQRPRLYVAPADMHTLETGREALELARAHGIEPDPWEGWLVEQTLAERADGQWSAFRSAWLVSRQNGKGHVLVIVELAGLYLLGERILHSAHLFSTSKEAFKRIAGVIDSYDALRRRVKRVSRSHGEEGIELRGGPELRFMARTGGAGRGFSADRVILDEGQSLSDDEYEAVLPTLSARPRPQVNLALTAPDPEIAPCEVVARMRRLVLAGKTDRDLWAEWSIDPHVPECPVVCTVHDDPASPASWAKANPALGIRISTEHVRQELTSMSAGGFARERLGVGAWPADADEWQVITEAQWNALEDQSSEIVGPKVFAADVTPDGSWGAIAVAGRRGDGHVHAEVVDYLPRTSWMAGRLLELQETWAPLAVVVDGTGPAGVLVGPLLAAGFQPLAPMKPAARGARVLLRPFAREVGAACAWLQQAATDAGTLRHLGQPELSAALAGAQRRTIGDGAWAWSRKGSGVDISPLVAVTLALWGLMSREHLPQEQVEKEYHYDPYPELELEAERESDHQAEEQTVSHSLTVDVYGRFVSPGSG